jgi:hypothetical protein
MITVSSALVIIHPQVNSTFRRGEDSDSRCPMSSWLAPAPSTADQDLAPEPGRDLPDRSGQHILVVGERVRPSVARVQQHGQGSRVFAHQAPNG